jgi:CotH kinase protein/Lamin Tail Domain
VKNRPVAFILLLLLVQAAIDSQAADARIGLRLEGANTFIQVQGDSDQDWRFQTSTDLVTWSNEPALGTLLSSDAQAPARSAGSPTEARRFYRALKTDGLFDATLLRTINLTFTQSNWQTLLASGRATGSNVLCTLTLDNGATNAGVGARYKGNTSYTTSGTKKSVNLELDYTNAAARLMGYKTINLNNAWGDETIMREPLYFNTMKNYSVSPGGSLVKLYINGANWGVYSFVEQENNELIKRFFPSDNGDRWKAPNIGGGVGGFSSARAALSWQGTNLATYRAIYELKTDDSTNSWPRLIHAIDVLNNTPTNQLRDSIEDVLAVDRWLWFLAVENVFADDDSYFNKGADYGFYYEPESGRIHPVEHDGNEAFTAGDVQLSPVQGANGTNRPVLYRLLPIPELRQRYLGHMRTVLQEYYNPVIMTSLINRFSALSVDAIAADPVKGFTMAAYTNDLTALKTFITNRYNFLTNHAELRPVPPIIATVFTVAPLPTPAQVATITAEVHPAGTDGLDSVWLYFRGGSYGRFTSVQMFDDGGHGDGLVNDGIFGAATTNYPAGTKVRYYIEARSSNSVKTASFAPPRAEQETFSYRVTTPTAANTPVVINEFMASNAATLADPQGEYDDWIELHNVTAEEVDLTGRYLSDEPNNPRKWPFPAGTTIPADGYLIVWADEDGTAMAGLHASFKLSGSGEQIFLTDTDPNFNAVLDSISFGEQQTDRSYGRTAANAEVWAIMDPTPGQPNY